MPHFHFTFVVANQELICTFASSGGYQAFEISTIVDLLLSNQKQKAATKPLKFLRL